jgi:hypothetical protein
VRNEGKEEAEEIKERQRGKRRLLRTRIRWKKEGKERKERKERKEGWYLQVENGRPGRSCTVLH